MMMSEDTSQVPADGFIGLEVKPGKPMTVQFSKGETLLITGACLGESVQKGERAVLKLDLGDTEYTVCSLVPFVQENVALDIPLADRGEATFSVECAKKTSVHVLGRFVMEDADSEGEESQDERALYNMMLGQTEDESDDEDYDEDDASVSTDDEDMDEDDEEDELRKKISSSFPGRSSTVEIEELDDDDVDEGESKGQTNGTMLLEEDDSEDDSDFEGEESDDGSSGSDDDSDGSEVSEGDDSSEQMENKVERKANGKGKRKNTSPSPKETKEVKRHKTTSNGTDSAGGKPTKQALTSKVATWLEKNAQMDLGDLGNKIHEEYKQKFKSFQFGSLKSFLTESDKFQVKDGKVTPIKMKKKKGKK
mmetsp:Transcript_16010/g.34645  ORF Transcript_16010/g.34645 Transcript_16010/m.34645 type:complete len:365 (-) Transcript_16010:1521-2615(-)